MSGARLLAPLELLDGLGDLPEVLVDLVRVIALAHRGELGPLDELPLQLHLAPLL